MESKDGISIPAEHFGQHRTNVYINTLMEVAKELHSKHWNHIQKEKRSLQIKLISQNPNVTNITLFQGIPKLHTQKHYNEKMSKKYVEQLAIFIQKHFTHTVGFLSQVQKDQQKQSRCEDNVISSSPLKT